MKKLLIVVDYQNDFVDGTLGCVQALKIEEKLAEKIKEYRAMGENGQIIFTMDTHGEDYMDTQEGKHLPVPHCIKGTKGWQLYGRIGELREEGDISFDKPTFGSWELGEYLRGHKDSFESIEFAGVVTNICVISNIAIAKAALPEAPIIVDAGCVASNDDDLQKAALDVMGSVHVEVKR